MTADSFASPPGPADAPDAVSAAWQAGTLDPFAAPAVFATPAGAVYRAADAPAAAIEAALEAALGAAGRANAAAPRRDPSPPAADRAAGEAAAPAADRLVLDFEPLPLALAPAAFATLRAAVQRVAAKVARCGKACRWQVRAPDATGQAVLVLPSDTVLRLHALLDGAAAMLELDDLLAEAGVGG